MLLASAMDGTSGKGIAKGPSPSVIDDEFESRLVNLLARLEHHKTELFRSMFSKKLAMLVQAAQEMIDVVTRFADEHSPPDGTEDHKRALAWLTEFHSNLQPLMASLSGTGIRQMLSLGSRSSKAQLSPGRRMEHERKMMVAAGEAISTYFVIFTGRFESSKQSRNWVEAAAGFLVELRQLIKETYGIAPVGASHE